MLKGNLIYLQDNQFQSVKAMVCTYVFTASLLKTKASNELYSTGQNT